MFSFRAKVSRTAMSLNERSPEDTHEAASCKKMLLSRSTLTPFRTLSRWEQTHLRPPEGDPSAFGFRQYQDGQELLLKHWSDDGRAKRSAAVCVSQHINEKDLIETRTTSTYLMLLLLLSIVVVQLVYSVRRFSIQSRLSLLSR